MKARARRDAKDVFLAAIRKGKSLSKSARLAGVSRSAAYKWLDDPDFKAEYESAFEEASDLFEDRIHAIALDRSEPNANACERILKRRRPEQWGDKSRVEHTGANGGPIRTVSQQLTPAERGDVEQMIEGLAPGTTVNGRLKHAEAAR